MSDLNNVELIINEIKGLIEDKRQTELEGSRRCLNDDDVNIFEVWIEILQKANESTKSESNLPLHGVSDCEPKNGDVDWSKLKDTGLEDIMTSWK